MCSDIHFSFIEWKTLIHLGLIILFKSFHYAVIPITLINTQNIRKLMQINSYPECMHARNLKLWNGSNCTFYTNAFIKNHQVNASDVYIWCDMHEKQKNRLKFKYDTSRIQFACSFKSVHTKNIYSITGSFCIRMRNWTLRRENFVTFFLSSRPYTFLRLLSLPIDFIRVLNLSMSYFMCAW